MTTSVDFAQLATLHMRIRRHLVSCTDILIRKILLAVRPQYCTILLVVLTKHCKQNKLVSLITRVTVVQLV